MVNVGSNQVSDFAVLPSGGLRLRDVVASGGTEPISVAIYGSLVEVLNAGGTPNVTGFWATGSGLTAIPGGSQRAGSRGPGTAMCSSTTRAATRSLPIKSRPADS